jgi:hypothetical protein
MCKEKDKVNIQGDIVRKRHKNKDKHEGVNEIGLKQESIFHILDVHTSVHRKINLIERINKMQPCSRVYYFNVS